MTIFPSDNQPLWVLRIAAFCLFLGRGWQFLWLRTPFHPWLEMDGKTPWLISALGIFFLINALISLVVKKEDVILKGLILGAVLPLMIMTFAMWQTKNFQFAQLIEQTAQWTTPLFLLAFLKRPDHDFSAGSNADYFVGSGHGLTLHIALAMVFTGHGMYAAGIYPQPAHFHFMVTRILGISDILASDFLLTAGILDFAVSMGVFIPRLRRMSLAYMIIWGTLTSFARIVAYIDFANFGATLIEWAPQTIYRLPHALLPLAALALDRKK